MKTKTTLFPQLKCLDKAIFSALIILIPNFAMAYGQSEKDKTATLDKMTVTGSRIARAQVEGPTAVVVISAAEIEKKGFTTITEALSTLTQFTGAAMNELDQTGATPNGSFLNLRGFGPGYQLILLNGKRLADYPQPYDGVSNAPSIGDIPASAVDRIEILSSGASAIYGSDAVAGVVNIITKTNYEGNTLRLRGGTSTRGGGDTGLFQWSGGKTGDNWSLTYAVEYLNRKGILASQRPEMDSYRDNPIPGKYNTGQEVVWMSVTNGGKNNGIHWLNNAGKLVLNDGSPEGLQALNEACDRMGEYAQVYKNSATAAYNNRCRSHTYPADVSIQNGYDKLSGYIQGTYDFGNGMQAYGQLLVTQAKDTSYNKNQYYWSSGSDRSPYVEGLGIVELELLAIPQVIGGVVPTTYDQKSINFVGGVSGTLFDNRFDWDANIAYSRYNITVERRRWNDTKTRDYFLGEVTGYYDYAGGGLVGKVRERRPLNVDRIFSPITADIYNDLTTNVVNKGTSENKQAQFSFSGDLFDMPAGPVKMATVFEAAQQDYNLNPDPRTMPNYTGNEKIYNFTATTGGGDRKRYAVGLEFAIPIVETLTASLAGRYDRYNDISNVTGAFTWQAGLEWRPFESLLLRGTHSTSFRAPDLMYLYAGDSDDYTYLIDVYGCRMAGLDSTSDECTKSSGNPNRVQVYTRYSGNKDLDEEKGKSTTFGVVWDIIQDMSLSVDYYKIQLENGVSKMDRSFAMNMDASCRIGKDELGNAVDPNSPTCVFYMGQVERSPSGKIERYTTYPINQAMMRTEGFDVAWRYGFDIGSWGRLNLQGGYTHVLKLETQLFPGDDMLNLRDNLLRDYPYSFRSKANWMLGWTKDDWRANISGNRSGSLPRYDGKGRIGPHILWNLSLAKDITEKATLGMSVVNVFNRLHPRDDSHDSFPYFNRAYSGIGRQIFVDYTFNF